METVKAEKLRNAPLPRGGGGAGITGMGGGGNIGALPHEPTDGLRNKVRMMTALGNSQEAVAFACDMCVETLKKYYQRELDLGKLEIKTQLGAAIIGTAMGEDVECVTCEGTRRVEGKRCKDCHGKGRIWVREPNPTAQVWASKNLMGWTDQQRIEHTGADGGPIIMEQRSAAPTVKSRLDAIRERQKQLPPAEGQ